MIKEFSFYSKFLEIKNELFWLELEKIVRTKPMFFGEQNAISFFSNKVEIIPTNDLYNLIYITKKFKHKLLDVIKYLLFFKNKDVLRIKETSNGKIYFQNGKMIKMTTDEYKKIILNNIRKKLDL